MPPVIAVVLRELRAGLDQIYGSRLVGLYLYAYARGEADAESDIDVLVVLDDFERYGAEVARTGGALAAAWGHHQSGLPSSAPMGDGRYPVPGERP